MHIRVRLQQTPTKPACSVVLASSSSSLTTSCLFAAFILLRRRGSDGPPLAHRLQPVILCSRLAALVETSPDRTDRLPCCVISAIAFCKLVGQTNEDTSADWYAGWNKLSRWGYMSTSQLGVSSLFRASALLLHPLVSLFHLISSTLFSVVRLRL